MPSRAVLEGDQAAALGSCVTITMVSLFVQRFEQQQDLFAGVGIEVACRLVGQDDRRVADQRPGKGHPLHLSPRELLGTVPGPLAEADPCQQAGSLGLDFGEGYPIKKQG